MTQKFFVEIDCKEFTEIDPFKLRELIFIGLRYKEAKVFVEEVEK